MFVNGRGRDVIMEDMRRRIGRGDLAAEEREAIEVCISCVGGQDNLHHERLCCSLSYFPLLLFVSFSGLLTIYLLGRPCAILRLIEPQSSRPRCQQRSKLVHRRCEIKIYGISLALKEEKREGKPRGLVLLASSVPRQVPFALANQELSLIHI